MARGITDFTFEVSPLLGDTDRELVGQLIIERLIDRTQGGRDIDNRPFATYSRGYIEHLRQIGADTGLDLTLTGEMLNSISVLSHAQGTITIGLEPGTFAANKATWNQGGNTNIPSRPFMGLLDVEINSIAADVESNSPVAAAQRFLNEQNIIGRVFESINLGF